MTLPRHLAAALIAAALASLAGCSLTGPSQTASASATTLSIVSELSPRNEVPPTSSTGSGRATVSLDRASRRLTWNVAYAGLTGPVTGAHIHSGAEGTNGPVVVPFTVTPSPIVGSATLTEAQVQQLGQALWYVNLHTAANPGGEIRGQLK